MIGLGVSLIAIAVAASEPASLSLSFTGGTLPGGVTLTRASAASYISSAGVLSSAAIDAARFDYLVNGAYAAGTAALYVEPAGTNTFLQSETLDNASVTKARCTITADAVAGPSGATTADRVVEDTQTGNHNVTQSQAAASAPAYGAVWLKADTRTVAFVQINTDSTVKRYAVLIDLATGAAITTNSVGTPVAPGYRIENWGGGWYRVVIWATNTSGTVGLVAGLSDSSTPTWNAFAQVTYTGNNTGSMYVTGMQIGATDMSYVATTTASASRSADVVGFTVPVGISTLTYTFDDDTTQAVAVAAGAYTIPTNLNRARIRTIVGS